MFAPINHYAMATHEGLYEQWPLTTPLLREGVPTGTRVPGFTIEAQYRWRDAVLLITSWDCPFEEALEFVLIGAADEILAHISLGAPYDSLLLDTHSPVGDDALRVRLLDQRCYILTILPPSGWRRRHRLRLSREPDALHGEPNTAR